MTLEEWRSSDITLEEVNTEMLTALEHYLQNAVSRNGNEVHVSFYKKSITEIDFYGLHLFLTFNVTPNFNPSFLKIYFNFAIHRASNAVNVYWCRPCLLTESFRKESLGFRHLPNTPRIVKYPLVASDPIHGNDDELLVFRNNEWRIERNG